VTNAAALIEPADLSSVGYEVQVREVSRHFEGEGGVVARALDGVTLDVEAGARVAVMGKSGSGKSTLLHLVGAMDTPTAGTICVGDWEVERLSGRDAARYRRTIGFVFQAFHLLGGLSVLDNVRAPLIPRRPGPDVADWAKELIRLVGLEGKERSSPAKLSGGEQQRVAIARALVNRPRLLLVDEPTGNLDSHTSGQIMGLLGEVQRVTGVTMLIATHDHDVATTCEAVVNLVDGTVESIERIDARQVSATAQSRSPTTDSASW
jgi:putative ABC transport system ATP-binding protein